MSTIRDVLHMLRSSNTGTRYEACELLRIAQSISSEARAELVRASADSDPFVAERARAALSAHPATPGADSDLTVLALPDNPLYAALPPILIALATAVCGGITYLGLTFADTFDAAAQRRNADLASAVCVVSIAIVVLCFVAVARCAVDGHTSS